MILIIDLNCKNDSLGFHEFVQPIVAIAEKMDECTIKHYLKVKSQDLMRCNRIILSGTALKDVATLSQPEKFMWVKENEKPLLGICAGMETIGAMYGMRLIKCLEIGMTQIISLKENPLFSSDYNAYSLHSYCVEPTDDFEIWAKSSKCAQVIKHKNKETYGILFHPEVRNPEIIRRFIDIK